jgi:hypothetical protein
MPLGHYLDTPIAAVVHNSIKHGDAEPGQD